MLEPISIRQVEPQLQDYLACGSDSSMAIDFYGRNDYSWCGNSSAPKNQQTGAGNALAVNGGMAGAVLVAALEVL